MFLKASAMESTGGFFEMNQECKVSCVEIIVWSVVVQERTKILNFYLFKYGAECSAESGAKYFINKPGSSTKVFVSNILFNRQLMKQSKISC